jgi:hypothetical protein
MESTDKYLGVLRIVQVSAIKYGIEKLTPEPVMRGFWYWLFKRGSLEFGGRPTHYNHEWRPWGKVFDPKKYAGYLSRVGAIYGAMTRLYFDSVADAEAYIEESRKSYPIVVKDPA